MMKTTLPLLDITGRHHTVAEGRLMPEWLQQRSLVVCANAECPGRGAQGQGAMPVDHDAVGCLLHRAATASAVNVRVRSTPEQTGVSSRDLLSGGYGCGLWFGLGLLLDLGHLGCLCRFGPTPNSEP